MCLLAIFHRVSGECPLFLAANREEAFDRPSLPPRVMSEPNGMRWLGGIDREAGGTWLGVNQTGLVVGVTNRNDIKPPRDAKSRGLLCRDLLACRDVASAIAQLKSQIARERFAGFNLLVASREAAYVLEHGASTREQRLSPGLHIITNDGLNRHDDPRNMRAQREFARAVDLSLPMHQARDAAQNVCRLPASDNEPALCVRGESRGTVSSQILALTDPAAGSELWFADGPPNEAPYESQSPALVELLSSPLELTPDVHRINLKGPWEYEALDGEARGRVTMPADWRSLFEPGVTRARFRRLFHQPSNIDAGERVFLVFDGVGGTGTVRLNDTEVATIDESSESLRFDITVSLQPFSELIVELTFDSGSDDPGGLHETVALEIESHA